MAIRFLIRGETIQLDQLLKATGLSRSGGAAKAEIAEGLVKVDGATELRKRAQLRPGQVVEYAGERIELALPAPGEAATGRERKPPKPPKAAPAAPARGAARPSTNAASKASGARPAAKASGARPGAKTAGARPSAKPAGARPAAKPSGARKPGSRGASATSGLWPRASGGPTGRAADRASHRAAPARPGERSARKR